MPDEVAATKESLEWFRTAREKWEQSKLSRRALRKLEPVIDKEATIDTSIQNPFNTVTSSGIIPKPESTQTGTNTVVDSRAGSSSERSHPFQSSSSKAAIHPPAVVGFKAPAVLNPFSFSGREGATGSSSGSEQKEDEVFGALKGLSFCTDETESGQTPYLAASPIVPTSTPFSFSPPEKEGKNAKNKRDAAPAFSTGKAPAFSVSTPAPTMEDNNKKNHPNAFSFASTTIGSSSGAFSGSRAFSVSSSDASQTSAFGSLQPPTSNPFSFATKMASTIEPPSATKTIAAGANQPTADTGNVTVDTAASTKRTSPFGSTKTNDTLSTPFSFSTLATGKIPSSPVKATSTGTIPFGQSTANPPSNPSPFAPTASGKRVEESSDSTDKYRERLVAFYELHNPAKLSSVDETLKKYAGKEEELFSKLKEKYKYPPPTGKGPRVFFDIEYKGETITVQMELFADKTPVAAENFRCLCTGEKGIGRGGTPLCYKGNKFHRIVRNMCLQGGDITVGNGTGGESIYQPRTPGVNLWGDFEDEMFLSHAKPGLLSMANKGKDTNNSQFFITLRALASLNGKHVVFGQIVSGMQDVQRIAASIKLDGDQPEESVIVVDCGEIKTEDGKEVFHRASDRTQSNSSFDGSGTNGGGFSGFGSGTSPFGPAGDGSSLFGGGGTPFGGLKSAPSIFGRPVGQVTENELVTKTVYAKVTDGERRADRDSSIEENAIELCSPGPKGSTTLMNLTAVLQPNETTAVNSKSDTGILTDHTKLDTSNLSNEYHESDSSTPYYDVPLVPVCGVIPICHSDIRESQLVNETMPGKSSRHSESRVDESTDDSDPLINSIATFESVVSEQIESLQRDIRESSMQIKTTKARLEKQQELISSRMGASLSPRRNTNALYLSSNQSTPSALSENEGQRRNFARGDVCSPSTLHPVNDESLSLIAKVVTISNLESSELDTRAEDNCSRSPSNTDNDADHHLVEPVELLCELEASTIDDPARDPGVAANATSEYSYEAALLFRQSGKVGSERKNRPSSKILGAGVTDDTLVEWQNKSSRSTTVVSPKIAARDSFSTHVLVNTETLTKLQREKKCVKPLIGKFDAWTKSHVSKQEHT